MGKRKKYILIKKAKNKTKICEIEQVETIEKERKKNKLIKRRGKIKQEIKKEIKKRRKYMRWDRWKQ